MSIDRLEFDVRKIKNCKDYEALGKYQSKISLERWEAAWQEIEKGDPVEGALTFLKYVDNWQTFNGVLEDFGLSSTQSETLNKTFRDRLKADPEFSAKVAYWHKNRKVAA